MSEKSKTPTSFHVIQNPDGEIWRDIFRVGRDEAINDFVKQWLFEVKDQISHHECWNVWNAFQRKGWKVKELFLEKEE